MLKTVKARMEALERLEGEQLHAAVQSWVERELEQALDMLRQNLPTDVYADVLGVLADEGYCDAENL